MDLPFLAARELVTHHRPAHRLKSLGMGPRFYRSAKGGAMNGLIEVEPCIWDAARAHLLEHDPSCEQAAFFFARETVREHDYLLSIIGARHIEAEELAFHSSYHLELKQETWSSVIKDAHQRNAALIEVHSH